MEARAVWHSGARGEGVVHSRNRVTLGVLGILSVSVVCGVENTVSWFMHPDGPVRPGTAACMVAVSPCTLSVEVCTMELSADGLSDARSMGRNGRPMA